MRVRKGWSRNGLRKAMPTCQPGSQAKQSTIFGTRFPTIRKMTSSNSRLAEALLADGHLSEARSYFVNLWDRTPGSGEVNLDLAHLSMRMGDAEQAIRYFRGAIYGSWDKDPGRQRRKTLVLSYANFFSRRVVPATRKRKSRRWPRTFPLEDASLHEVTGQLFLKAGEPGKALAEFEAALQINPRQRSVAGRCRQSSLRRRRLSMKAETYLARAYRENPSDEILGLLETIREVLTTDPFLPGLSDEDRTQRSWRAFHHALDRLENCSGMHSAPPT